jgi:thiol-disulfide isomerase/thioredoxin
LLCVGLLACVSLGEVTTGAAGGAVTLLTDVTEASYGEFAGRGLPFALLYVDCSHASPPRAAAEAAVTAAAAAAAAAVRNGTAAAFGRVCVDALSDAGRRALPRTPYLAAVSPAGALLEYDEEGAGGWDADRVSGLMASLNDALAGGGGSGATSGAMPPPPPPRPDADGVVALAAATFEGVVGADDADTFVVFYNPGCGHCMEAIPQFVAAARRFRAAGVGSVVFATYDVALHAPPPAAHFHGVPALLLFRAGARAPMEYDGEVTEADILAFLRAAGTWPGEVPVMSKADAFRDRDVFGAVADGLDIIREQMRGLREENARLRARLVALEAAGCTAPSHAGRGAAAAAAAAEEHGAGGGSSGGGQCHDH